MKTLKSLLVAAGVLLCGASTNSAGAVESLARSALEDKIRGGWAGQMIGVAYGAPTEFRARGRILEDALSWAPERIGNAIHQDDLYVEMTFAAVMDKHGWEATTEQYGEAFRTSKYGLWHANAAARRNLNRGIAAPDSGHPKYNAHANDIDFQIEADFIGLMTPGLPQLSNTLCDRVGRVMNYGDGLYGGMFVCGMYSAAFFDTDVRRVVEAGLACIPPDSSYARLIQDVLDWSAQYPNDWRKVWALLKDKWDKDDPCPDGALADFNIDAKLNGAFIAIGLLFGGRDFEKTMEISTRCGQDSDCNPSSAAGILGVMLGYAGIPEQWRASLARIADQPFEFTEYSFNSITASTVRRALAAIQQTGGQVLENEVRIAVEKPHAPKLEQWTPGVPERSIGCESSDWKWTGNWVAKNGIKTSANKGDAAELTFDGVGVILVGPLDQASGRADVYLDDRKAETLDAYIVERTHDNALWHVDGLTPGRHTIRLIVRDESDPRSRGRKVAVRNAVIFRGAAR